MPTLKSIKFSKNDQFGNFKFTTNTGLNYETLKDFSSKLVDKEYDSYLPIYHSVEYNYASITCKKNNKDKLFENSLYDLDFTIRTKKREGKTYIGCYINSCKLIEKIVIDLGEELNLE
jgi:hypothetical protein